MRGPDPESYGYRTVTVRENDETIQVRFNIVEQTGENRSRRGVLLPTVVAESVASR